VRSLVLGLFVLAPVIALVLWSSSVPAAIGVVFVSHMLVLYPTLSPNSRWLGPVITRFKSARNEVWLTIDDGPLEDTRAILDLLERHGARATFFVKGINALRHPHLVEEIREHGHQVANHSHTHPSGRFWCALPGSLRREITLANDAIGTARLFRAPVGHKNPFVHPILQKLGMRLVGWSARGWDMVAPPEKAAKAILEAVQPGAIVLLHQGHGASPRANPRQCLEMVVEGLAARGYSMIIPDESRLV